MRNKEKQEVDFLITKGDKPILSIECKLADTNFDPAILSFAKQLGLKHHIQLVASSGVMQRSEIQGIKCLTASADTVLSLLV